MKNPVCHLLAVICLAGCLKAADTEVPKIGDDQAMATAVFDPEHIQAAAGELASTRAENEGVRQFGRDQAHLFGEGRLQQEAGAQPAEAGVSSDSAAESVLGWLASLQGDAFDVVYLHWQSDIYNKMASRYEAASWLPALRKQGRRADSLLEILEE